MAIFKIEWSNGVVEVVNQSDRDTVEGYIDCRFGASYDPMKAKVSMVVDKPADEAPKVAAKATAKKK